MTDSIRPADPAVDLYAPALLDEDDPRLAIQSRIPIDGIKVTIQGVTLAQRETEGISRVHMAFEAPGGEVVSLFRGLPKAKAKTLARGLARAAGVPLEDIKF